jgi:NAD-dependent SIR2 family protein deacetylase
MGLRDSVTVGALFPDIVLYNDKSPRPSDEDTESLIESDLDCDLDLLLIFGTSLRTFGSKRLVSDFAKLVHENQGIVVFINKTPPNGGLKRWEEDIDYWVCGDCDEWVQELESGGVQESPR